MPLLTIKPRFYPIRLQAYMKNDVELSIDLENLSPDTLWTECAVHCPEALSLAPDRLLSSGRIRVGILEPSGVASGRCKIYAGPQSYPDVYTLKLVAFAFGKDGAIIGREERKAEIRCESFQPRTPQAQEQQTL